MTKRLIATGLLVVLLALAAPAAAAAAPTTARLRTVVLVLAPYLRWEDVLSGNMPETRALVEAGAVGDLNVRSLLPDAGQPTPDAGALMLSAGTWARSDASGTAPVETSGTPAIVFPGLKTQLAANANQDADIRLGTLGEAIERAGGWTAAIGNGDSGRPSRPAALVAMDSAGDVRYGDISGATVATSGASVPPGRVSDAARIEAVLADTLAHPGGPRLVVVDPGDLARAHVAGGYGPDGLERKDRLAALEAFDALLGRVRAQTPSDALLVVAAPVAAQVAGEPSGFGPLIVSGDGWSGMLTSPSTHRVGLVTNADLTATILSALGVPRPAEVSGEPATAVRSSEDVTDRMSELARTDAFMRAVDAARPSFIDWFILAAVVLVAACAALVVLPVPGRRLIRTGRVALLGLLSLPAASLLMYVVLPAPQTPQLAVALLLGTAALLWAAFAASAAAGPAARALAALALLTAAVIAVDQWFGAPLSLDGFLGYSPLVGARFFGMGNEAAALMIGAAVTGCALLCDTYAERPWVRAARTWVFPAVAVVCILSAAAPMLGANVGVAVWGTLAFGLAWWGMLGRKVDWRVLAAVALAVVVLVGAFTALDLHAGGGGTHLGRAVLSAERGGLPALWTLLSRKAATNVRLSLQSEWTALAVVLLGALAYMRARPKGSMRDLLTEKPSFAAVMAASLAAAVVSYLTEDSGIIVPALLLLFPSVALVFLMLEPAGERGRRP